VTKQIQMNRLTAAVAAARAETAIISVALTCREFAMSLESQGSQVSVGKLPLAEDLMKILSMKGHAALCLNTQRLLSHRHPNRW